MHVYMSKLGFNASFFLLGWIRIMVSLTKQANFFFFNIYCTKGTRRIFYISKSTNSYKFGFRHKSTWEYINKNIIISSNYNYYHKKVHIQLFSVNKRCKLLRFYSQIFFTIIFHFIPSCFQTGISISTIFYLREKKTSK